MAQATIKQVLGSMYTAANARYARRGVDKMPTYVKVTVENLAQGIKHSYGLAQKKKGKLPFLDDGVFHDAGKVAMEALRRHLRTPSKKHAIRIDSGGMITFVQSSGRDTEPFRKIKLAAMFFLQQHLDVQFDEDEVKSFNQGLSRQHGAKEGGSDPLTVGMMQFATSMNKLTATSKFGGFAGSYEAKALQEKFGTQLYFTTKGRGRRRRFTIKESVQVSLTLMSSELNPAGAVPTDWKLIKPQLEEAIMDWASRQDWYNMKGSPSMMDDHEDLVLDSITTEITKGKNVTLKKGMKRKPRSKDKYVTVSKPLRNKLKGSKKQAAALTGDGSKFNIHNIIAAINLRLHDTLMDNMTAPRLVYRSGRFAESVVANAALTPKGNISIGYNYQTSPYAVFAPGGKMYTPQRNPQTLIEGSIREIAAELAIGRYGIRRT